jgi:hypothetical protein
VVEHELGHELGFDDTAGEGLMGVFLSTGVRRVRVAAYPATGMDNTAPVLLRADVPLPTIVLSAGHGRVAAAVTHLLLGKSVSLGALPPAMPDSATAWLADRGPASAPTSASGNGLLAFSTDDLSSATNAIFAWLEDNVRLFSDPLALTLQVQ